MDKAKEIVINNRNMVLESIDENCWDNKELNFMLSQVVTLLCQGILEDMDAEAQV